MMGWGTSTLCTLVCSPLTPACEACQAQAVSQRGLRFRLEVYRRTDGQGWAVRTLASGG